MGFWRPNGIPYMWYGSEWKLRDATHIAEYLLIELKAYDYFSKEDCIDQVYKPHEVYELMHEPDGEDRIMEVYDEWITMNLYSVLDHKAIYGRNFECCGVEFVWTDDSAENRNRKRGAKR